MGQFVMTLNSSSEMQEQHLAAVAGTYFDGLSTALMPAVLREDIWETYDILDRTRSIFTTVAPLETVVTGRDDKVIATSDPRKTASIFMRRKSVSPRSCQSAVRPCR